MIIILNIQSTFPRPVLGVLSGGGDVSPPTLGQDSIGLGCVTCFGRWNTGGNDICPPPSRSTRCPAQLCPCFSPAQELRVSERGSPALQGPCSRATAALKLTFVKMTIEILGRYYSVTQQTLTDTGVKETEISSIQQKFLVGGFV